jgi:hypothetical protein
LTIRPRIVTLETHKEKYSLASRAVNPSHDPQVNEEKKRGKKLSAKDAAAKLASLIEQNMERKGLTEGEKNRKVGQFSTFVKGIKRSLRKS